MGETNTLFSMQILNVLDLKTSLPGCKHYRFSTVDDTNYHIVKFDFVIRVCLMTEQSHTDPERRDIYLDETSK